MINELSSSFSAAWLGITGAFDNFMAGLSAKCPMLADIIMVPVNTIKGILDGLKQSFNGVVTFVSGVFTGNWGQAWDGVVQVFSGVVGGLGSAIKAPLNGVIGLINKAIGGLNKIQVDVPDWVPGMGGKNFGFNIPEIPALARGGVVTAPTLAVIGEGREHEAVLLLSKLKGMLAGSAAEAAAKPAQKTEITVNIPPFPPPPPGPQTPNLTIPAPAIPAEPAQKTENTGKLPLIPAPRPGRTPNAPIPFQPIPAKPAAAVPGVRFDTPINTRPAAKSPLAFPAETQRGGLSPVMDMLRQFLEMFKAQKPQQPQGGAGNVQFAPNVYVTVEGRGDEAKIQEAVKKALSECYEEFKAMYERVQWEKERTAFNH